MLPIIMQHSGIASLRRQALTFVSSNSRKKPVHRKVGGRGQNGTGCWPADLEALAHLPRRFHPQF
eukprot:COSAG01_NODE_51204_length_356_cov_2.856031_1_plen_64_part_01